MADKKENLKALFSNTRSRVIIIFTAILLTLAVLIGYFKLREASRGPEATAALSHAPGVQSIPGALNPTAQYAKLQEEQNVNQAQNATTTGGSAIPTIIRTQAIGEGVGVIGTQEGQSGVGFTSLARNEDGEQKSLWLQTLQNAGCSKTSVAQVTSQGAQLNDLKKACSCAQLKDNGYTLVDLNKVCPCKELKAAGYNATQLKQAGYDAAKLRDCGFNACELRSAGFTAQQLKDAGFSDDELKGAGYLPEEIIKTKGHISDCSIESLKKAKAAGVSAAALKRTLGCSAKGLKDAGYTARELKDAGFTAEELKNAGFNAKDLKNAGFSAKELKDAGFTAAELKDAGFNAKELKDAGFTTAQLKEAGFGLKDLVDAGLTPLELQNAGFNVAGLSNPNLQQGASNLYATPAMGVAAANNQQLEALVNRQNQQMAEQKHQQKIQQTSSNMMSAATQLISEWKNAPTQVYIGGNKEKDNEIKTATRPGAGSNQIDVTNQSMQTMPPTQSMNMIKTGDVLFAVIDTSVNSDEPGPILATVVSGKLKGTKLIGSFNLPGNSNKVVISFNTMSIPGAPNTISIAAFAIDPNTARTAIASRSNHHYLSRYGSLFASSFIEGFGDAFQSANTTVTVGGTGGGNNVTIANGVGRSTLSNAVIGLATVGRNWGQQAQMAFNRPTTVEVYSGTPVGILFTQDVKTI